jgi:DNA-binding beta-propeller fold protein YncE
VSEIVATADGRTLFVEGDLGVQAIDLTTRHRRLGLGFSGGQSLFNFRTVGATPDGSIVFSLPSTFTRLLAVEAGTLQQDLIRLPECSDGPPPSSGSCVVLSLSVSADGTTVAIAGRNLTDRAILVWTGAPAVPFLLPPAIRFMDDPRAGLSVSPGIALSPDGRVAYVLGTGSGGFEAHVVDTAAATVTNRIPIACDDVVMGLPTEVVFAPGGNRAYVVGGLRSFFVDTLAVIDTVSESVEACVSIDGRQGGGRVAVDPLDGLVYAVGVDLFVIDPEQGAVVETIDLPRFGTGVAAAIAPPGGCRFLPADTDCDGEVTGADEPALTQRLFDEARARECNPDCNQDGIAGAADLTCLVLALESPG